MEKVTIGGKELYETYGCFLASKLIGMPEVQTKYVSVPSRDGAIDLTESLSGVPRYNNRTIEINLIYLGNDISSTVSEIAKLIHGRKQKIIFSDDLSFYYYGRISIEESKHSGSAQYIKLLCDCDPFKYDVSESDVDWEWDVFDFDEGIINEAGELIVNGTREFTLICRRKREFPIFTSSSNMELVFNGNTYSLLQGSQKLYRVFFDEGENKLTFNGTGTVSIKYIGGSL